MISRFHLEAISQRILNISILEVSLKIIHSREQPHLPGVNELSNSSFWRIHPFSHYHRWTVQVIGVTILAFNEWRCRYHCWHSKGREIWRDLVGHFQRYLTSENEFKVLTKNEDNHVTTVYSIIIVSADGLAPPGARASAGTVMALGRSHIWSAKLYLGKLETV